MIMQKHRNGSLVLAANHKLSIVYNCLAVYIGLVTTSMDELCKVDTMTLQPSVLPYLLN
jgi:hypothetical protein